MALTVPDTPDIETTIYESFKGVDYTNDSTNVWYKRSPSGVNMLPDASGRPFKRKGWEIVVTGEKIASLLGVEEAKINRCFYFELAGIDHILIFADGGVFTYANDTLTLRSTDVDCYASYDRAYFFEANGRSAFYIYGNYKFWVYEYTDDGFSFSQETDIYVPRILIGTDPSTCSGTKLYDYNLAGNRATVEYSSNDMFHTYTTGEILVSAVKATFAEKVTNRGTYTFTYDGSAWGLSGSTVTLSEYGITVDGTPESGDKIVVVYAYGVLLPNNVAQNQLSDVSVDASFSTQFDKPLTVLSQSGTLVSGKCRLMTDTESYSDRKAWIEFYDDFTTPLVDGEDLIRVTFPVTEVTITNYVELEVTGGSTTVRR